jgi:hypothetical protein
MTDNELEPRKDSKPSETVSPLAFHPGWRFYAAFSSVSAITLMVALDASSLGNALPVSLSFLFLNIRIEVVSKECVEFFAI